MTGNSATYTWTESGSATDAAATNWTSNWTVPTQRELNELYKAAGDGGSNHISCTYTTYEGPNVYGFLFTGKGDYADNSLFFPIQFGFGDNAGAYYWSGTASGSSGRYLWLRILVGSQCSYWNTIDTTVGNFVRPILNEHPGSARDIALDKTATTIGIGADYAETLTASVSPSNALNKTVTWSSDNPHVATVDATTGKVTGNAQGTATITATAADGSGVTTSCTVRVVALGSYVTVGDQGGVVYFYNSRPYIVSTDRSKGNWYEAKTWCSNKGDGWYLPSKEELLAIYKIKDTLNATLSANGWTNLGTDYYWSSTEVTLGVSAVNFNRGDVGTKIKNGSGYIRAVRAL